MNINKLYDLNNVNINLVNEWNNVIHSIENNNEYKIVHLDVGRSHTYIGNFFKLLNNEYGIDIEYWYPHLAINKLKSNTSYAGNNEIKIIDPTVLDRYLDIFTKNK